MFRPSEQSEFDVQLSTAAWSQLGRLSADNYQRVRAELRRLALAAASEAERRTAASLPAISRGVVRVGSYFLEYRIDRAGRRICLDAIGAPPEGGQPEPRADSTGDGEPHP